MMKRRHFFVGALATSAAGIYLPRQVFAGDLIQTPSQTRGPFYPIPEIEKQPFLDADLTRLSENAPVADGEIIAVRGTVVDLDGKPLDKVIVEVWQACATGRYNHPNDKNDRPMDPNFQYWTRILTGEDGAFAFKTIQPGKYPGRTPHIHYRIVAPKRAELETQMYFEDNKELNEKDGVLNAVKPEQRKALTVGFNKGPINPKDEKSERLPVGDFQIVLGPASDSKSTPAMP